MPPTARQHPPSVDALARSLYPSGLPHPLCVDVAREAIAADDVDGAPQRARVLQRTMLTPVVNATGDASVQIAVQSAPAFVERKTPRLGSTR